MIYLYFELPSVLRIEVSLDELQPIMNLRDMNVSITHNYET